MKEVVSQAAPGPLSTSIPEEVFVKGEPIDEDVDPTVNWEEDTTKRFFGHEPDDKRDDERSEGDWMEEMPLDDPNTSGE